MSSFQDLGIFRSQ